MSFLEVDLSGWFVLSILSLELNMSDEEFNSLNQALHENSIITKLDLSHNNVILLTQLVID